MLMLGLDLHAEESEEIPPFEFEYEPIRALIRDDLEFVEISRFQD